MAESPIGEIGVGSVVADTYEVTSLLGRGGMGAVWLANHRRLPGKRVAIKVLLNAITEGEALARFRREAEIASRLGHPNIVEVIDFHATPGGTPYMVLEFLQGESLAGRLKRGPMSLPEAMDVVRQVGSALAAAHREGVVHRDLKPDNIFLCPTDSGGVVSYRVKVLDFGISKIRGSQTVQTQDSALLGTPQYMSPEQAYGKNRTIDQRTDVWALGAIVYEMLTGRAAFAGETLAEVILNIVHQPTPSLSGVAGVPPEVARAVDKALAKEAADRYPDIGSFIGELTGRPLVTLDMARVPSGVVDATAATAQGVEAAYASTAAASSPSLSTQPRGELAPVPPTHHGGGSSRTLGIVGAAIGVGALIGVGIFMMLKKPPAGDEAGPKVAAASPPAPTPPAPTPPAPTPPAPTPPAPTPPTETPTAPPPDDPPPPPPHATEAHKGGDKHAGKGGGETLPPEVIADLDAADQKLAAGDVAGALHLARRTLNQKKSSRAFAVITRAYCKNGDLGNAKANFRSVGRADRAAVARECKKADIDLP